MAEKRVFTPEQVQQNLIPDEAEKASLGAEKPVLVGRQLFRDGLPVQDVSDGKRYERFLKDMFHALKSGDPEITEEFRSGNESMLKLKLNPGTVGQVTVMQNLALMYANDDYQATRILPVINTSGVLACRYAVRDRRDRLAYPDDAMTARAEPNELNEGVDWVDFSLRERSLKASVSSLAIQNQAAPLNELSQVTTHPVDGLMFNRELRVAALLGATATFGSGHYTTLTGADCWDSSDGGDPALVIDTGLATLWSGMGPGDYVGWMSLAIYNVLKRHPKIADFYKYRGSAVYASPQLLADYFGLDEIVVCRAKKDTANRGAAESVSRIWNNTMGLERRSSTPSLWNVSFGWCVQDVPAPISQVWYKEDIGSRGGWVARASYAAKELVTCTDCGYLITPLAAGA